MKENRAGGDDDNDDDGDDDEDYDDQVQRAESHRPSLSAQLLSPFDLLVMRG